MRWLFVGACAAGLLAGCEGKKAVDPRLCADCRRLAGLEGDDSARAAMARQELRTDRERRLESLMTYNEVARRPEPAVLECPECDRVHERLIARQKR